ncbi:MAG: GntR family transcriptional regulator [Aestuariivirga sp.]
MTTTAVRRRPVRSNGAAPIYAQVAEILNSEVKSQDGANAALPSEYELSREFGVSRVTIRQALKQLEMRGIIYSEHGRGYFKTVSRLRGVSGFHSFTSEVREFGGVPSSETIDYLASASLPDELCKHLEAAADQGGEFIYLKRVRMIDGSPVAIEDAYLPSHLYPGMSRAQLEGVSLYEEMTKRWGVVPAWTDALFGPAAANAEQACMLKVKKGSPLTVVWRVTVTETDRVVEYVKSIYRGNGFMLNVGRHRL